MAQDPLIRREPVSDRRLLGSQCCMNTGLVVNGIRLIKRCNDLSSRSEVTRGLPDLGKSFTLLVCVCFLTSRQSCTWTMPLTHYSKFSMFTLRIWVFKSGVLKKMFILSKHGTKANIRSTKMVVDRRLLGKPVLFEYGTDCEWHPSSQTLQ
jgi:hypothetical protein